LKSNSEKLFWEGTMKSIGSIYEIASQYLPGGVNASARVNKAIRHPFYVSSGDKAYLYDLDGRKYIDMCMSHGASLLGHNHPKIKEAVSKALELGVICSYETQYQISLAKNVSELVPCAEMIRFAGSGTEAIMHALRLARTTTGREKIIKFEGHFHGYSDEIYFSSAPPLEQAGPISTPLTFPQSAGIPRQNADRILVVPFNNPDALEKTFTVSGHEIAALILEPINYDSGCILPKPGFLSFCRELCNRYGVLLFFDEVLTAFRVALGGAQEYFGVVPDLAVLGKAFGGGMPITAIVGKRGVMSNFKPLGQSEHSGTYMAHLTSILAALASLEQYSQPGFYENLNTISMRFYIGFQEIIKNSKVPMQLQYAGPRFGMYFGIKDEVTNYRDAAYQNYLMLYKFISSCFSRGVYFHVSPHHGISAAHVESDVDEVLNVIEAAMFDVKRSFMNKN
jgi:glutamate-1-semialdehyde 2,1-aminomutase